MGKKVRYIFMRFPAPSEAFASAEVRAIRRDGWNVSVACMRARSEDSRRLLTERGLSDLPVSYAGAAEIARGFGVMLASPGAALRVFGKVVANTWRAPKQFIVSVLLLPRAFGIAQQARLDEIDVVHLFWGHFPSLVGVALREMGRSLGLSMSLGAYDLIKKYPLSRVAAQSAAIVTHAEANRPDVARLCAVNPRRINVVYRGIEIPEDTSPVQHPIRMLVVERFVKPKRTIDSLKVFANVAREYPEVVLEVLGDGPERDALEQWVAAARLTDRVCFRGHLPHDEALERMEGSALLLSMSQSPGERLPNVVKEAMARRNAVVVTRTPGIEELVSHGNAGFVVSPGAVDEATGRVGELLADPDKLARFGEVARAHVGREFDIEKTTRARIGIWQKLIADSGRGAGV
ncbi:glycosyltransferase family 4 protein [Thioalkalivibrio sp. ALJ16]|uniref:glycosyltransferase family 4 protein n=1 Tax=Thioalkalivibrio sp. ALJ16 TaxID=1158762 RepID=UPI000381CC7C|nr:glycosyltransferase family 4 protein [Thioalkalivibrio sp. ALJ16]